MKQTFSPAYGTTVSISATTTTANAALSESDMLDTVLITNIGDDTVYVRLGRVDVVATEADLPILPKSAQTINRSRVDTYIAVLAAASTATVKATLGYGV